MGQNAGRRVVVHGRAHDLARRNARAVDRAAEQLVEGQQDEGARLSACGESGIAHWQFLYLSGKKSAGVT